MQTSTLLALMLVAPMVLAPVRAAERAWEVRAEFESFEPGPPEQVVLRLPDGSQVKVALEALSESSRAAARAAMAAEQPRADGEQGVVTVRGPFGRSVRLRVAEAVKDVESDAIRCRTAREAADVYRLYLVGESLPPAQREAAEARLAEWSALSDQGVVRLGDRWVSPAEASAAAAEARNMVAHALELMRLGNGELAEDELRKASRIDPESGRANFIMGLGYALVAKNPAKAVEQFTEAAARQPGDPATLNDLAVLEVLTRRCGAVAGHFLEAADNAVDPAAVCENLAWAMMGAGAGRSPPSGGRTRVPEKTLEELNAVYRTLTQVRGLKAPAGIMAPQYLGPDGSRCTAQTLADIARHCVAGPDTPAAPRRGFGFLVAPGRVVCPRDLISGDGDVYDDIELETSGDQGRRFGATLIAAPDDGCVALLMCDQLTLSPLPLAERMPPMVDVIAIGPAVGVGFGPRPTAARGKVATATAWSEDLGLFVHTAPVARGAGGGPILDATGRVIGMVATTPRADASGNAAGLGVPVERIWSGIRTSLPADVAPAAAVGADAAAAERRALTGTVLVVARKARPPAVPTAPR